MQHKQIEILSVWLYSVLLGNCWLPVSSTLVSWSCWAQWIWWHGTCHTGSTDLWSMFIRMLADGQKILDCHFNTSFWHFVAVLFFISEWRVDYVILCAWISGGIMWSQASWRWMLSHGSTCGHGNTFAGTGRWSSVIESCTRPRSPARSPLMIWWSNLRWDGPESNYTGKLGSNLGDLWYYFFL